MVKLRILDACKIGDLKRVQSDETVQPELVDANGAGCLHYAARGGSLEIVKYLIKAAGFSVLHRSNTGSTALHDAAARGNTAIVKWLVEECSMNVDDQDGVGITALHLAARYCHPLTVEWLLDEACADEKIRTGSGAVPLFFAVVGGDLNCVKLLMDENPRLVNMQLNNGATPLYIACQNGLLDIAQYLHSRNGATKIKAYDGMSCLHAAAQLGYLDLVKWLVQVGECNPNDRDFDGATPLHYAASRGHCEIVRWLLSLGGARVTLDNLGGSPLHSSAEMGELQTVQALLETGCDVTLVDNQGLTAAELADKCDQSEAAALIRGEVTLDQLQVEESFSDQELSSKGHTQLTSPRLNFPPPPPFPPEEEDEDEEEEHPVSHTNYAATAALNQRHQHQPGIPPEPARDPPSSYPSPPPPVLHDSPLRGRGEREPTLPPPPPPPAPLQLAPSSAPPLPASAPVGDPREVSQQQVEEDEEVFRGSTASVQPQALGSGYSSSVRRGSSRVSVNSSTSDLGAFEITTVIADVHKSRGSIDSVSAALQTATVPSNNVTTALSINSVAVTSNQSSSQYRKFSVLKHIRQNTGIQETPELENGHHSSYRPVAWSASRRQRSPSPPLPSPPPLSPGSESFNSEDASLSTSTSCSNLPPHESDLPLPPPPPAALQSQPKGTGATENLPPPPPASSSNHNEELPPPPPQVSNSEWQTESSSPDFPDPPSPARLAIAARQKLNPVAHQQVDDNTSSTATTAALASNFKQYFDSGTRANFARAKALFGATGSQNGEARQPSHVGLGPDVHSKPPGPARKPPQQCINPDSGETESDCSVSDNTSSGAGTDSNRQLQRVSNKLHLQMDPGSQSVSNGTTSPALSTNSDRSAGSSVGQDSVRSSSTNQGGHVTIISTSRAKAGDKESNGSVNQQRTNGPSTNIDVVKGESSNETPVPVPVYANKTQNQPQEETNGVVMRESNRPGARIVVSAGPEILKAPKVNGQARNSTSVSEQAAPVIKKNKNDLIADIQSAVSGTSNLSLRRAKSRGEGVSMVFSSKRHSTGQDAAKVTDTSRPLTGDFDPKNFLDQVETEDATGRTIPEWRRHVLAKHAAEKAQKDFEEKRVVEDYESRFKDMPAWKRALIERREAQAREEEAASKK